MVTVGSSKEKRIYGRNDNMKPTVGVLLNKYVRVGNSSIRQRKTYLEEESKHET